LRRRRNRGPSRRLAAALALLFLVGSVQADEPATPDAFLEMGLRQVDEGDFEAAVFSLDTAVRRLPPGATPRRVQAYVHLGAAYVGMGQAETAKGKFREALALDPDLRLDPQRFPPNVLKVFETQALKTTAARKKRSGRIAVTAGGAAAAGAIAAAVLTRRDEPIPNAVPTASFEASHGGYAVVGVTLMTFRASGADPDGDPLNFRWTFSDGEGATGETVTHRYVTEGTFTVTLTAEDGRGGAATATATVTARSLTGNWRSITYSYTLVQNGPTLSGFLFDTASLNFVSGTIGDSRTVAWTAEHAAYGTTHYVFSGVADERLETITGVHQDVPGRFTGPVTLVRE
jgi:chitodextrinase